MPRDASLWRSVDDLLEKGSTPVITLAPSSKVVEPPRPPGRPRVRTQKGFHHWPLSTPAGQRMFCRASGCRKRLNKGHSIVCSQACADALREECSLLLGILDGKVDARELPPHLRTQRLRRKRTL